MPSDGEVHALRQRLLYDAPFWSRHCATVLTSTKGGKRPVKLIPRPWQARTPETLARVTPLDEALEKQRKAGQPMRVLIGKARKLGFSTWTQARIMQRVTQRPHEYAITAAHRRDSSKVLYDMAKLMYEHLPTDAELAELIYGDPTVPVPFRLRPDWLGGTESRQGGGWMVLGDKKRKFEASIYETMTAGSKGMGRAYTPTVFHGSEVAHYEDPDALTGALSSVPLEEETMIILETTALGFNHFFDMWDLAKRGAADSETGGLYVPLFYGWQDNPFNRREFVNEQARDRFERTVGDPGGGGDPEELWLVEEFGVSLEQLFWRRSLLNGPEFNSDLEKFHQEHPATDEQMFIGSGHPVFPGILVSRALREAERAVEPVEGVLRALDLKERRTRSGTILVPQRALWVPREQMTAQDIDVWGMDEQLRVWGQPVNEHTQADMKQPKPDGQYVVFADVARGKGSTSEERDYQAIQVIDHVTRMQVCSYRSRIPLHDYPLVLLLVALYYNRAWLAVEATGLGQGPVDALAKDYRYGRLYSRHRRGDDRRTDSSGNLIGWETTLVTKPLMETTFGTALSEGTHGLRCLTTGREMTTYIEDEKGHHARKGAHDDLLMAFMGAHRVAAELKPRDPNRKPSSHWRTVDDVTGYGY